MTKIITAAGIMLCSSSLAMGQAMLGYAATAAASAPSAASASKASQSASQVLHKVSGSLRSAAANGRSTVIGQPERASIVRPPAWPVDSRPLAAEDFRGVSQGAEKNVVFEKLGSPTSKVLIPEEGKMVELYRYSRGGTILGTVRIVDGTVDRVDFIN